MPVLDPVFPLVIALVLALLWFAAAMQKLQSFAVFAAALADYRLVPDGATSSVGASVVVFELGLGGALMVPALRFPALLGSVLLLALYAAAIAINLLRGRRYIDCGCMGATTRQPLSGWLVTRNLLLALLALVAMLPAQARVLVWFDFAVIAFALGVGVLLYSAINRIISNALELVRLRS